MNAYDERFLTLARTPQRALAQPTATGIAENPLCGDEVEITLRLTGSVIGQAGSRRRACAMVAVSAALLVDAIAGTTVAEGRALADRLERSLADPLAELPDGFDALSAVRLLPLRRRCALLPWIALRRALDSVA